ncbi:MAG TPA: extracellular solute-binding protein [Virgibacillus sp.]|nr:extracellular solute-binding protein [Virgibacillus sp.]
MKVFRKKWLMPFAGALFFAGALAGCSSDDDTGGSNSGGDGEISGDMEIQYFVGGYGDEWWKEVISDFEEEYPDVNVKQSAGPEINDKMKTRWISEDPPDVVYIDGAGITEAQMVDDGQLMDLTDWLDGLETDDGQNLMDSFIMEPNTYDGKIYGLPLIFDTWGTWYDSALFEEEGWDPPEDFDSWMDSMETIKDDTDMEPFVTAGQYAYYFTRGVLYPAFGSAGGEDLLNDIINGEEGVWKRDEVTEVLEKVEEMVDAGYVDPGFAGISHTQSQSNFLQHDNAYIPVGFWLPSEMEGDIPDDFEFGFGPTPMNDPGENQVFVPDIRPLAIAEEAKNPEAAKAFVQFAYQKEYAVKFSETGGALINIEDVDLSDEDDVADYLKDSNEMINSGEVDVVDRDHPMASDMEEPIGDEMVSFLLGESNVEEFTDAAEKIAEEYREGK